MRKIIITYGLIAGTIVAAMMFISMPLLAKGSLSYDKGELVGYTTMVVSLSMVFFGIKTYRDKHAGGAITFGKAFKVGILITIIASIMYGLAWEVCYNNMMPADFMQKMSERYVEKMQADGATAVEIQAEREKWANINEWYKNPFVRFAFTLMEILPVGIAITLLSAALLRKKEFLPANPIA